MTLKSLIVIMCLTRQPEDRYGLSVLANIKQQVSRLIWPKSRAAYLFFRFKIAIIKRQTVSITMNSSYVLISIILLSRLRTDGARPPGCPVKYIILSKCRLGSAGNCENGDMPERKGRIPFEAVSQGYCIKEKV